MKRHMHNLRLVTTKQCAKLKVSQFFLWSRCTMTDLDAGAQIPKRRLNI